MLKVAAAGFALICASIFTLVIHISHATSVSPVFTAVGTVLLLASGASLLGIVLFIDLFRWTRNWSKRINWSKRDTQLIMKPLIALVIPVVGAFVFGPMIIEGASNNCAAVEKVLYRLVVPKNDRTTVGKVLFGLMSVSDGRFATAKAAEAYPYVPRALVCARGYWGALTVGELN